jgi:prophage antirepressor-like protein
LTGQDGEKWLVARELCEYLQLKNITVFVKNLPDDCKQRVVIDAFKSKGRGGDNGARIIVNEEGANRLISKSIKPEAEIFKTRLSGDVVPAIRETGSYTMKPKIEAPKAPLQQIPRAPKTYKEAIQHLLVQRGKRETYRYRYRLVDEDQHGTKRISPAARPHGRCYESDGKDRIWRITAMVEVAK